MPISPLAGKPAPKELLIDPARLEREYFGAGPISRIRTSWSASAPAAIAARRSWVVHRSPHPRHHPGDLRLPEGARHRRPAVHGQGHACHVRAGAAHGAGGPGGQRRRDRHPARRRCDPDSGHLAGDPGPQPRPDRPPRRWHHHHAVAQPARGRRVQVQPDEWRPGRHRRHQVDRRTAPTNCCATATPASGGCASPPPSVQARPTRRICSVPMSTICAMSSTWTPFAPPA